MSTDMEALDVAASAWAPAWGSAWANLSVYANDSTLVQNGSQTNDTQGPLNSFYFFQTAQFAVLWALFVLIVLGNLSVLLALAFNKHRKSRMNFFIMQLAIADLAVGLISVPTDLVWHATVDWHAGNLACKLIRYLQVLVTYSSTYVLVALSIDRYDAITHPMNFSRSGRRSRCLVAGAWALSCLFAAPILVLFEERDVQGHRQCWIELSEPWMWRLYMSLVALVLFALPALIISFCYTVIVCTIWNKSHGISGPRKGGSEAGGLHRALLAGPLLKRVKSAPHRWGCARGQQADLDGPEAGANGDVGLGGALGGAPLAPAKKGGGRGWGRGRPHLGSFRPLAPSGSSASAGGSFTSAGTASVAGVAKEEDCRRASSRGLIPRAKVKTVKMTLVIVFVFVLCWSPYFVINLLQVYDQFPVTQTTIAVSTFIQSLAPLNSAANPLIYCLFSTHICRTLRKVPPFTWVLALRDSPATTADNNNSGATETVTHLGTSPCRRDGREALHRHHVTLRVHGGRAARVARLAAGPLAGPAVAISAV